MAALQFYLFTVLPFYLSFYMPNTFLAFSVVTLAT